jgi:hypothetical protein
VVIDWLDTGSPVSGIWSMSALEIRRPCRGRIGAPHSKQWGSEIVLSNVE